MVSNSSNIESVVIHADLVIGAILAPGAKTPRLVTRDIIAKMRNSSVTVDVAIDQGDRVETSVPTTFDNPIYEVSGVIHCCITNMPSAIALIQHSLYTMPPSLCF
jgi:alanine dehydrogenase